MTPLQPSRPCPLLPLWSAAWQAHGRIKIQQHTSMEISYPALLLILAVLLAVSLSANVYRSPISQMLGLNIPRTVPQASPFLPPHRLVTRFFPRI